MSRLIVVFIVVSMICGAIALSSTKMADEKEEEDEKKNPKAIAGTVIAAAQLTLAVLESVLSAIGSVNRKIAIGVANESGMDWQAKNAYYHSGTSDTILPQFVPNDKALLYDGRKTHGPVARGAVGVVAYHMSDGTTLGVLFSVPFDYNFYDNWWNIKIYEGKIEASEWMYEDLYYYANPFEGDNSWEYANLGEELRIAGFMTSSGEALLDIHVMRR